MRALLIIFCFLSYSTGSLFAQNLVPNPSFELFNTCPPSAGGLGVQGSGELWIQEWYSMNLTPDYMHECAGLGASNYPQDNAWGYQEPYEGQAFISIGTYDQFENTREYIAVELDEPLTIGQQYYMSFYASDADGGELESFDCSTNNIGLHFFNSPPYYWNSFDDNFPLQPLNSAHLNYSQVLTDSVDWTLINGEFIANQPYTHLAIGNFYDDTNTDILQYGPDGCSVLYYIDHVCVSLDSIECSQNASSVYEVFNPEFIVWPNPSSERVFLSGYKGNVNLILSNNIGMTLLKRDCAMPCELDLSGLSVGSYYLQIHSEEFLPQTIELQHHD